MSDKEILEELEAAWDGLASAADTNLARRVANGGVEARHFVYGYLAAKRKYQQTAQPGEVKTRQTFEEWLDGERQERSVYDHEVAGMRDGWNAALASVISTGKRFEVGDEVEIDVGIAVGD